MYIMAVNFADRSGKGHVLTNNGGSISASESVFGNRSAYFDGASYVSVPDSDDFNFNTNDFTIDFWCYFNNVASTTYLLAQGDYPVSSLANHSFHIGNVTEENGLMFILTPDGTDTTKQVIQTNWAPSISTWYHFAFVRSDTTITIYVNGVDSGSGDVGSDSLYDSSLDLNVGGWPVTYSGGSLWGPLDGYMDHLRIYKGKALWTENFTPPNAPVEQVKDGTVLLLNCNGTNGSTNFTDSGTTVHSVTANGDAQVSTAQSKFGGSSAYFDGTGDHLSIPTSSDWDFGVGEFTIDFWMYIPDIVGYKTPIARDTSGGRYWFIQIDTDSIEGGEPTGTKVTIANILSATTWHHVAMVRSSDNLLLFVDGILGDTAGLGASYDWPSGSTQVEIGRQGSWDNPFTGYIDELRVSKGVARWTSNFIPPVESYPAYDVPVTVSDETVLLIHADGDNASTTFKDYGVTGHTITAVADAEVSTTESKFGGASAYFDGTGDYLSIPDSDAFYFDTNVFCQECWIKSPGANQYEQIMGQRNSAGNINSDSPTGMTRANLANTLNCSFYDTNTSSNISTTGTITVWDDNWHHIAFTCDGTNIRQFVDGVLDDSVSLPVGFVPANSTTPFTVGRAGDYNGQYFAGYIDEIRITKGSAVYTEAFTPPTAPYPDVQDTDVKLLLHGENLPTKDLSYTSDTYFKDSSASNHDVFPNGDATLSATQSKFGSKSMYFDGTGDYLRVLDNGDWYFSGDFTIDCWVYFISTSGSSAFTSWHQDSDNRIRFDYNTTFNELGFSIRTNNSVVFVMNGSWTPSIDTWYHVAITRSGSTWRSFVNGTQVGTSSYASYPDLNGDMYIGSLESGSFSHNGYIDEMRISKGIARWTSNFTPPVAPYKDYM